MSDDSMPRDTGKLWGAIQEIRGTVKELRAWIEGAIDKLMVILTGVNGDNGLRGDIKKLEARVSETESEIERVEEWGHKKVEELWHEKREPTCIGKKLIHDYEQRHIADHDRETEEREAANLAITQAIAQLTMRLDNQRDRDERIHLEREKERRQVIVQWIATFGVVLAASLPGIIGMVEKLLLKATGE